VEDEKLIQAPDNTGEKYATIQDVQDYLGKFWANERDPLKFWGTCRDKEEEYFDACARRGLFNVARLSFSMYYGTTNTQGTYGQWQTQSVSYGGDNQELLEVTINEYRSFVDQITNMACRNRPAFQAQVSNTDYGSLAQVNASDSLVQYFYEDAYGERKEREVVKIEELYGKAYTHVGWDPDDGEVIQYEEDQFDPATGMNHPVQKTGRAGKLTINRMYWWDVACEPYRSEFDDHQWRLLILPKRSKVELQARYPLYAKQIETSSLVPNLYEYSVPGCDPLQQEPLDLCAVRIFYYRRSMAMPLGRKVVFVNDVMVDDNLARNEPVATEEIPLIPFMTCELHGTSMGISELWNLIPLDQLQNQVMSDVATNLESFGRPSLALVEGSDVDIDALANGAKIVFVPPGKDAQPQPIKFPEMPQLSLKAIEMFRQFKQSLSGLNAIARGDTSTNITSGAHAALYSQIAIEAQSERALALDLHRERVGNLIIQLLKHYAKHPQLVAVAGIDERPYMQYFEQKDWGGIKRVKIKTANPMMKNQAGRMQMVELLQKFPGLPFKDPQQIVEFVNSGTFKPMIQTTRTSELRIRFENEALFKGPQVQQDMDQTTGQPTQSVPEVPVLATDNAASHIFGHLEVLNSPAAMNDPKISGAVLAHIMQHVQIARNGDIFLAQLLGNPPPQQAPQQPGQPPPDQAQQPGAKPPSPADQKRLAQNSTPPQADTSDDSVSKLPKPAEPPKGAAVA
jgi:hypothetical protein